MPSSEHRGQAVVVLDPGHGGEQVAGRSTPNRAVGPAGTLEKDVVLELARRIRPMLEADRVKVVLTRDRDRNPSLASRAATARRAGASAFVSLHLSAGQDRGTLTCVHRHGDSADRQLATEVHRGVIRSLGTEDLGVHAAPLAVLDPSVHASGTACCLVELSTLSDPDEEQRLGTVDYRSELAGAVSHAILDWLHRKGGGSVPVRPPLTRHQRRRGHTRALVVGIDDYSGVMAEHDLRFASKDAWSMATILSASFGMGHNGIRMLLDREAGSREILLRLRELAEQSEADDVLCLVFAGRGTVDDAGRPAVVATDGVALDVEALRAALAGTSLRELWIIADAGFGGSGASRSGRSLAPGRTTKPPAADRATDGPQVRWLSAAGPGGDAFEHVGCGHGLFTAALLRFVRHPCFDIGCQELHRRLIADVDALLPRLGIPTAQRPWLDLGDDTNALFLASAGSAVPQPLETIRHTVPLVPQMTGMSCWAAGAAMLIGWRDRLSVRGNAVAQGAGTWESYHKGLRPRDVDALARSWGLVAEPHCSYTIAELHRLLMENGPLWVGEADPDLHVVVIAGMWGDGTVDGTQVMVLDPWPVAHGERYTLGFRELIDNLRTAGRLVGRLHAQVLHTGGRPG